MDIASRIREFIASEIGASKAAAIGLDTDLRETGIDSLGLMEVVSHIEEDFGIVIDYDDLTEDNFKTLRDIERLIAARLEPKSAEV